MKGFPRRERIPLPPLHTICLYKTLLLLLRYSSRPSQTAAEPFSLSPVGNPSGGCQLQPHGNLTPALSPGHSRVSIIIPPACRRHRRVLSPTVGFSSYGSPISRQRKCCTGSIGIRLSKISLAQPVTKKIRLPGATLCNACPIWSRRLFECLENPLHDNLFLCRQRLGYLFK